MSTFQIDASTLKALYRTAGEEDRKFLEEKYGKSVFNSSITDRIKTWEDAAAEKGIDPVTSLPFAKPVGSFQEAANAFFKLDIISTVLLEGVVLDWANEDQYKYYAWFNNYKPGSGFSFGVAFFGWTDARTAGGARLCVDTSEKAAYFGRQFIDIFNQFLNPNK